MGIIKQEYKPKKENEIKLNSYLKKKDGKLNRLGKNLLRNPR
jgi:hypothetical protein